MSNDSSDPIDPDAILGAPPPGEILSRLLSDEHLINDPEKRAAMRELLRCGIPVAKAAESLDLPVSVGWRMLALDDEAMAAKVQGDRISLLQRRNELDSRADRMIRIIDEIACDPENDPKARLAAAQDLIDRSGKYPKVKDDGGDKKGAEITIEADWRDRLFKIQAKGS